jgi:putative ABC transport system permease protein
MISVALATVRTSWRRLLGTAAAIILGVGFLTGTLVLGDTLTRNFTSLFTDVTAGTDAVVRGGTAISGSRTMDRRSPVPEDVTATVAQVDGVAAAVPEISGLGTLLGSDGQVLGGNGPPRLVASWVADAGLNPYRIVAGRAPAAPDEVVVNRGAAESGGLTVGSRTVVRTPQPVPVRVVGIATFGDQDGFGSATYTAFSFAGAREHVPVPAGTITDVLVRGEPGVSQAELRDRIARVLPGGTDVVTGAQLTDERLDDITSTFLAFLRGFLVAFAGIALLAAAFTIHNTFQVTVSQRTRELALLRAVGASKRQVATGLLVESAVVGAVSSLVGVAVGVGVAQGLKAVFDLFGFALPDGGLSVTPQSLAIGFAAGTLATLVAALAPVRAALRVPPVAALRDAATEAPSLGRLRVALGVLLAAGGAAVAVPVARAGSGSTAIVSAGGAAFVLGVLLLAPLAVRPVTRAAGAPLAAATGVSGAVAVRNTHRNPRRASATAVALAIGVTVVTTLTVTIASARAVTQADATRTLAADLAVTGPGFGPDVLSPDLEARAAAVPGVAAAVGVSRGDVAVAGTSIPVSAADPAAVTGVLRLRPVAGSPAALAAPAGSGQVTPQVAVQQETAAENGWRVGSTLDLTFADGRSERVRVGAVLERTELLAGVLLPDTLWREHTPQLARQAVYLTLAPGADAAAVRAGLTPLATRYGGEVQDQAGVASSSAAMYDLVLNLVYVMLALAIVIALLGIATTVSLAVHERRRELGLLRAVGQTRRQARSMIRVEAVLLATFGTVVGLGLGTALGWLVVEVGGADRSGTGVTLPAGRLATVALVGVLAGVLAAARPARRAARQPVLDALAAT